MSTVSSLQTYEQACAVSSLSTPSEGDHLVHFYEEDTSLFEAVGRFLYGGVEAGDRLIVVATDDHRQGMIQRLRGLGADVQRAIAEGQLALYDARDTLDRFMVNGAPDRGLFCGVLDEILARATRGHEGVSVRIYGEMVDLLWRDGFRSQAILLEELWNEAGAKHGFSLLCAYIMANFYTTSDDVGPLEICRTHNHVIRDGHFEMRPKTEDSELRRLRNRVKELELELEKRRDVEKAVRLSAAERLNASEGRFHQLLNAVTDHAIFMLDGSGIVSTWNAGARSTTGYADHEILGAHVSIIFTPQDRAIGRPEKILETVRRTGRFEEESWLARKDGSRFWANVVVAALRDARGVITGFAKVTRDLTQRRSVEEERRTNELERVSRAKDEFLATMSHELRSPLNAILGWSAILRKKPRDEARLERGLEVIARNARAQERLIGDLLDVSRIISGKLQLTLRRVEISAVVQAAADVVRPATEAKGVRLVVDLDPDLGTNVGDSERLQQVMWNLLSNAVRYTPRGGHVLVTGQRCGSVVVLRVEDSGIGIPQEELPFIFDRFRQVDSSVSRRHGGLGLGLAIVRHLVEAHGGTVEADSPGIGQGTTFTVTFPVRALDSGTGETRGGAETARDATDTDPVMGSERGSLDGVRVLVVDDDPDSLEILGICLGEAGAKVTPFRTARQALAAKGPFDIVVSDIGMPEIDGYSFMRRFRSQTTGADIPAIALTAYARSEDAARAMRAGYHEHFAKPVDAKRLLEAVRVWAQTRRDAPTP